MVIVTPGTRRSPSISFLLLPALSGNYPGSSLLAEVWGIPLCRRNWAEIVEGKEKRMKRDSAFPAEYLVQRRRAGRALGAHEDSPAELAIISHSSA